MFVLSPSWKHTYLRKFCLLYSLSYLNDFSQYSVHVQLDSGLLDFQANEARLLKFLHDNFTNFEMWQAAKPCWNDPSKVFYIFEMEFIVL